MKTPFFWKTTTIFLVIICILLLTLLLRGKETTNVLENTSKSAATTLIEIEQSGGYCIGGSCPMEKFTILTDGSYSDTEKKIADLSTLSMEKINTIIDQTDFVALANRKPNTRGYGYGCSSAVDGPDMKYTFHTSKGIFHIDMCTIQIEYDEDPFFTIEEARLASSNT